MITERTLTTMNNTCLDKCVSFTQAKELKELGFNDPVKAKYIMDGTGNILLPVTMSLDEFKTELAKWTERGVDSIPVHAMAKKVNDNLEEPVFAAPSYDEVIDWAEKNFGFKMGLSVNPITRHSYTWINIYNDSDSASGMGLPTKKEAYDRMIDRLISYLKEKSVDTK